MGGWKSSTASSQQNHAEDPVSRYQAAMQLTARLAADLQPMINKAAAAGFGATEALALPAIRQALHAARVAVAELAVADELLPS
jgi:hypothetical protein